MTKYESVLTQALELDEDDRQMLLLQLELSLDREPGYEEAWAKEIHKRISELDNGAAEIVEWDEAERLIFDD